MGLLTTTNTTSGTSGTRSMWVRTLEMLRISLCSVSAGARRDRQQVVIDLLPLHA